MKTYRVRDIGYDANQHASPWFDVTAKSWSEAVALLLEVKPKRVSFTQRISEFSSIHAVYGRSPTGGHNKIGCVQFDKVIAGADDAAC